MPHYVMSKYGTRQLCYEEYVFNRHVCREAVVYWRCTQFAVLRCKARIKTHFNEMTLINVEHNHPVVTEVRKYGALKELKRQQLAHKADSILLADALDDDMKVEHLDTVDP